jgi:hypothetical protein
MTDQLTALEIVRRANAPDPFKIVELMRLTNEMLMDVSAHEANNGVINVTLQRNIQPMGDHRIYDQGVGRAATQTKIIHDRIATLGEYSRVDKKLIDHSGNKEAAMMSEAVAIIKGMGLTQAYTLIYGNGAKPEEFDGLFMRRNTLSDPNVIDAGGTGSDLTSIYLIAVGPDLFHLIYPKGASTVGVTKRGLEEKDVPDSDNPKKQYRVYEDYFEAEYGLAIRAPDAVKRICNIPADMSGEALLDLIMDTRYRLPQGASTYVMYSNINALIKLDKTARDKGNVAYTAEDPWGKPILHVRDLRCRRMDVIHNAEAQVV